MVGAADVVEKSGDVARFTGASTEVLAEEGIDDLAKYRIVLHLLQNPWLEADAEAFAASLGFHSAGRTAALLEEMSEAGLLSRQLVQGGKTQYCLSADSALRRRLQEGFYGAQDSPGFDQLLRRLAQRSVARAKRELRRLKAG